MYIYTIIKTNNMNNNLIIHAYNSKDLYKMSDTHIENDIDTCKKMIKQLKQELKQRNSMKEFERKVEQYKDFI